MILRDRERERDILDYITQSVLQYPERINTDGQEIKNHLISQGHILVQKDFTLQIEFQLSVSQLEFCLTR